MWVLGDHNLHDTILTQIGKVLHLPDKRKHPIRSTHAVCNGEKRK